jgi:hypothetical protein
MPKRHTDTTAAPIDGRDGDNGLVDVLEALQASLPGLRRLAARANVVANVVVPFTPEPLLVAPTEFRRVVTGVLRHALTTVPAGGALVLKFSLPGGDALVIEAGPPLDAPEPESGSNVIALTAPMPAPGGQDRAVPGMRRGGIPLSERASGEVPATTGIPPERAIVTIRRRRP